MFTMVNSMPFTAISSELTKTPNIVLFMVFVLVATLIMSVMPPMGNVLVTIM